MKMIDVIQKWALPAVVVALGISSLNASATNQRTTDKRKMLSKHRTVAQFEGVSYHRCMGRTSACPDQCGNSGTMASFRILKYLAYEKPGKYGDPQQKRYQFLVQDNMKNVKVTTEIKTATDGLQTGDYVLLDWQHDYVTKAGSQLPERIVQQLKRISREEADTLTGGLEKLKEHEAQDGPSSPPPGAR